MSPSDQKNTRNRREPARRSHKRQSRAKPQDEEEENPPETAREASPKGKPKDTKRKTSEAQQRQGPANKRRETTVEQDSNALISSFPAAQGSTSLPAQHAGEAFPGVSTRSMPSMTHEQSVLATHFDPPNGGRSGHSIQHRQAVQRSLQTASQAPTPQTATSSLALALCDPAYHQQSTQFGAPKEAAPARSASDFPGDITSPFSTLSKPNQSQIEATHAGSPPRGPQPNPFLLQPLASTHPSPPRRAPEQMEHMMERQRMLHQRNVDRDDPRLRQPTFDTPGPSLASPAQSITSNSGGLTQAGRFSAPQMGAGPYGEDPSTPSWASQKNANLVPPRPVQRPGYPPPKTVSSEK